MRVLLALSYFWGHIQIKVAPQIILKSLKYLYKLYRYYVYIYKSEYLHLYLNQSKSIFVSVKINIYIYKYLNPFDCVICMFAWLTAYYSACIHVVPSTSSFRPCQCSLWSCPGMGCHKLSQEIAEVPSFSFHFVPSDAFKRCLQAVHLGTAFQA